MRYSDLTYEQIRDCASRGWLAIVPTGCTEQQGPHLPVDFDTWFAEPLCIAAAERVARDHQVESLMLPAFPFGPTPEHRNYGSGYIDIPVDVHDSLVLSVLTSLADQGFRKIVVWRGHDLRGTVARFNDAFDGRAEAFLPEHPYHDIWCRLADASVPGGHADSFTTSIVLHLRPEAVLQNRIVNPDHDPIDWNDPELDFSRYSSTGVIGNPTHASAELGAKLWEAVVAAVASIFRSVGEDDATFGA